MSVRMGIGLPFTLNLSGLLQGVRRVRVLGIQFPHVVN